MSVVSALLNFIGHKRRLFKMFVCILTLLLAKQLLFLYRLDIVIHRSPAQEHNAYNINLTQINDILDMWKLEINANYSSTKSNGAKHKRNSRTESITVMKTDGANVTLAKYNGAEGAQVRFSSMNKSHNNETASYTINNFFHLSNKSEKDPLLNLHKYAYSINSGFCKRYKPDILIFVHSATSNEDRRSVIRNSWGKFITIQNVTFSTVFMIGQTDHESIQRNLQLEAELYGDIVQGNFKDSYKNLTYKHIMGFNWVLSNCPTAKLFVKADDDVIVNVFNMVNYISKTGFRSNFLYCSVNGGSTMREKRAKWYVTRDVYPFDNYPKYCLGMGYLISPDVARILYKASENTRFYWVDDVYVTGILTLKVAQRLTPMIEGHWSAPMRGYHRASVQDHMFLHGTQLYNVLWKALMNITPDKLKETPKFKSFT